MTRLTDKVLETPSQTAGPYVHIGCMPRLAGLGDIYPQDLGQSPVSEGAGGTPITITGAVLDGTGTSLRDAMLESWQADAAGLFAGQAGADPAVSGFCRFAVDPSTAEFTLRTIKPGATIGRDGMRFAPHIAVWIVARGINLGLSTRIYFADGDNDGDPLLARITPQERAQTLLAVPTGAGTYRFDIRLQGPGETVFLDI